MQTEIKPKYFRDEGYQSESIMVSSERHFFYSRTCLLGSWQPIKTQMITVTMKPEGLYIPSGLGMLWIPQDVARWKDFWATLPSPLPD